MDGLIDSSAASPAAPTRPDVPELLRLLDAATPATGESGWVVEAYYVFTGPLSDDSSDVASAYRETDAALIAALHNAAPWLLAQAAAVARVEEVHREIPMGQCDAGFCAGCEFSWPCPTIAALAGPGVSE